MNPEETTRIPSSEENVPAPSFPAPYDPAPASPMFWPGLLMSLAFNLFLISQIHTIWNTSSDLNRQEKILLQQVEKLQNDVVPARNVQALLEGIANDLLVLAETDPDARRVVDKFQIRRDPPSAPAGSRQ